MRWDLESIAAAVQGIAIGDATITAVVTDSRLARPGALFVALRGTRSDGHEFAAAALEAGASAVLVEAGRLPDGGAGVEVADPAAALIALGIRRRSELSLPVVAVTGSSGKTTTKDLIAAVLGPQAHASPSSFNNEIGVPLTVLGCPSDASALVLEVGSRGVGHIAALAAVIRPDVAVITNVGPAHLEMFGDLATVRRAKWELVDALPPAGVAVLPLADPALVAMRDGARLTFGEDPTADVAVTDVEADRLGRANFTLAHAGRQARVALAVAGRHQAVNAAAAVAAAVALGMDFATAAERLAEARLSPWRMEVLERNVPGGQVVVVNDAYNANPASMESAFVTVAAMPGRHLAVLGMMHELGVESPALHEAVGRRAAELGFGVIVVGDDPGIARGAGRAVVAVVANAALAAAAVASRLRPGDVVLVKASRATGLEQLGEQIGGGTAA
jgi:UDP-N-acetylmuramoyl-tripeptide--D-alanyl-D-alanine ligase